MPIEDVLKHQFHHIIVINVKKIDCFINVKKIDCFEIYLERR